MKCLTPECQEEQIFCRGLCRRCYVRLLKRVQRKTITWGDLIVQGLAKRTACSGASPDARRDGQISRYKNRHAKNPAGLSDIQWQSAINTAREKLANPGNLTETERLHYNGILSLAGDG